MLSFVNNYIFITIVFLVIIFILLAFDYNGSKILNNVLLTCTCLLPLA